MKTHATIDMTTGPIGRKLLLFAYPLILRSVINALYGTVDKVVAGRCIGTSAMAAVGSAGLPCGLLYSLVAGLSLGVSVCCGNFLGGRKLKEYRECAHTAIPVGFLSGLMICVVGTILSKPLLLLLRTPSEVFGQANTYLRIMYMCYPLSMFNSFCCCIMNANGDTKAPALISFVSGFVNAVFDVLFVVGFKMDIAGLGWATFLSHATDTVAFLWVFFRPNGAYRFQLSKLRIEGKYFRAISTVGMPSGISATVLSVSNMILQTGINSFGAVVVAANTAADSCCYYVGAVIQSFGAAAVCAVSQCYGALNFARIKTVIKKSILIGAAITFGAAILVTLFLRPMLWIFTDDGAVVEAAMPIVLISVWGYLIMMVGEVYGSALRGCRKSSVSMWVNLVSSTIPRVLWVLLLLPLFKSHGYLFLIHPIAWTITAVLLKIMFDKQFKKMVLTEAV